MKNEYELGDEYLMSSEQRSKIEALKYAISVCETRKALFKRTGYNVACDEIKLFLEAAISRVEAGQAMMNSNEQSYPDWIKHWIIKKEEDNRFYHYWPDNTEFGPCKTFDEAAVDCIEKAKAFDDE